MTDEGLAFPIGQVLNGEAGQDEPLNETSVPAARNPGPRERVSSPRERVSGPREAGLPDIAALKQVTLHRESAGRGGRTVTLVSLRPCPAPDELGDLAKALRKGLGCGARVEGERVALQGDIPDRARDWFLKKGAGKVVRGN
jgi:translation initiation factor 1 (eIF-1/SUI1)